MSLSLGLPFYETGKQPASARDPKREFLGAGAASHTRTGLGTTQTCLSSDDANVIELWPLFYRLALGLHATCVAWASHCPSLSWAGLSVAS